MFAQTGKKQAKQRINNKKVTEQNQDFYNLVVAIYLKRFHVFSNK